MKFWAAEDGTFWAVDPHNGLPPRFEADLVATFREVETADIPTLAAAMNLPGPELIEQRLANARRCFILTTAVEIITYGWVTHGIEQVGELERQFNFQPNEAYIWHCGTVPAWRQQHAYSAFLSQLIHHLAQEGITRIWIGASRQNVPSIHGFINAGFQPVVDVLYRRLFKFTFFWVSHEPQASQSDITHAYRIFINKHERRWGHVALGYYNKN